METRLSLDREAGNQALTERQEGAEITANNKNQDINQNTQS